MPTYLYETIDTVEDGEPRRFEMRQSMKDPALTHDPETGLPVKRVIQASFYMAGVRRVVAPLKDSCCGPEGGACHH